mmetsp:Transcript_8942/g.22639  ORF Transcript_8942/g.22639 Transcript_8942/m.22639 type:complete len:214 (+) Transcript_8942:58-699(+)
MRVGVSFVVLSCVRGSSGLATWSRAEHEVKKSRFVAQVASAATWGEAEALIAQIKDEKARHNCYAWVGSTSARSSDDGEPSGTAAKPIREAIAREAAEDVVVVVTRYKPSSAPLLGAGGLIRAYGTAARLALRARPLEDAPRDLVTLELRAPLRDVGKLESLVGTVAVQRREATYDADAVTLGLDLDRDVAADLEARATRLLPDCSLRYPSSS